MTHADKLMMAIAADDAFSEAIEEAGYKSRWDWDKNKDQRPMAAYLAKVKADADAHASWEQIRATRAIAS